MKKVYLFAIEGGPCGGKTDGVEYFEKMLRKLGFIVLVIPEIATILKSREIKVENIGNMEFQKANYEMQALYEKIFLRAAKIRSQNEDKDVIILCDRGRLSGAAYMENYFEFLANEYSVNHEEILHEYAGVIHLVTTAIGAESYFTRANNTTRDEDIPGAQTQDMKSREPYKNHENFFLIPNTNDAGKQISFDEKLEIGLQKICGMLGIMVDTNEVEYEAKGEIDETEYAKLLNCFHVTVEDQVEQVNSFFDQFTNGDYVLDVNDITLRTREKKSIYELTCKFAADRGGRNEPNHTPFIDSERQTLLEEGILPDCNVKVSITQLGFSEPFNYQGDLVTLRIERRYKGCKVDLDLNHYLGKTDYEIEVERYDSNADEKQILKELLADLKIPYRPSKAKRRRFFDEKRRLASL